LIDSFCFLFACTEEGADLSAVVTWFVKKDNCSANDAPKDVHRNVLELCESESLLAKSSFDDRLSVLYQVAKKYVNPGHSDDEKEKAKKKKEEALKVEEKKKQEIVNLDLALTTKVRQRRTMFTQERQALVLALKDPFLFLRVSCFFFWPPFIL
jgi:hypothetical protein